MEQQRGSEGGHLVGRAVKKGPGSSPAQPSLGLWPLSRGSWDLTGLPVRLRGVDGWGPERSRCSQRPVRQACTEHLCSLQASQQSGEGLIQSHPRGRRKEVGKVTLRDEGHGFEGPGKDARD